METAIKIGILAFVYVEILTAEGMIFDWIHNWCEIKLPAWLFKMIIGCSYCVAGQIALWSTFDTLSIGVAIFTVHVILTVQSMIDHS